MRVLSIDETQFVSGGRGRATAKVVKARVQTVKASRSKSASTAARQIGNDVRAQPRPGGEPGEG